MKQTRTDRRYDVIVAGGGLTGVAAAVSAARLGKTVLLIEESGCLGGAASQALVFPFMPYWTKTTDGREEATSASRPFGNTFPNRWPVGRR